MCVNCKEKHRSSVFEKISNILLNTIATRLYTQFLWLNCSRSRGHTILKYGWVLMVHASFIIFKIITMVLFVSRFYLKKLIFCSNNLVEKDPSPPFDKS